MIKLIAFDLDGTLTQHRTKLEEKNKLILDKLSKKYKLLMVGAGECQRIHNQMNNYPIDIIGNYGLTFAKYDSDKGLEVVFSESIEIDKNLVAEKTDIIRKRYGYTEYAGEPFDIYKTGQVVFALIGTKAKIEDKLAFDPTREKRRKFYEDVKSTFTDFNVFIGGSSSFDMAPKPYNKYYALKKYMALFGYSEDEVLYVGDDYGYGGNDECIYNSPIKFCTVDDYNKLEIALEGVLGELWILKN